MTDTIPVIDIGDYLTGRPGALQATARQVHDALTTVGFFVLTGHDVPVAIDRAHLCRGTPVPRHADGEEARAQAQRAQ